VGFDAHCVPVRLHAAPVHIIRDDAQAWQVAMGNPPFCRRGCSGRGTVGGNEHAVLLHIALRDDAYGSEPQREAVFALEDELEQAIAAACAVSLTERVRRRRGSPVTCTARTRRAVGGL
jgi:hypothetical protein